MRCNNQDAHDIYKRTCQYVSSRDHKTFFKQLYKAAEEKKKLNHHVDFIFQLSSKLVPMVMDNIGRIELLRLLSVSYMCRVVQVRKTP